MHERIAEKDPANMGNAARCVRSIDLAFSSSDIPSYEWTQQRKKGLNQPAHVHADPAQMGIHACIYDPKELKQAGGGYRESEVLDHQWPCHFLGTVCRAPKHGRIVAYKFTGTMHAFPPTCV
jgi:hypothetical protein